MRRQLTGMTEASSPQALLAPSADVARSLLDLLQVTPKLHRLTALLAALPLVACLGSEGGEGPGAAMGGKADGAGGGEPPELAGDYALVVQSEVEAVGPEGERERWTTGMLGLATISQQGEAALLEVRPCRVNLPRVGDSQPSIDGDLFATLPPVVTTGVAYYDDQGVAHLATDPAALQLGLDLESPLSDQLPTDDDDPAVVDHDNDGRPGITVDVSVFGDIFTGARVIFSLVGGQDGSGRIAGETELDLDYEILGDSIPFVDARESAAEASEDYQVVAAADRFALVPLGQTGLTCSEALAAGLDDITL